MMMPAKTVVKCRKCGFEKAIGEGFVSKTDIKEREVVVLEDREMGMPTTKARCEDCGHNRAYWWLRQLRAADESEVRFFRCMKCGKTWREYN